ncbi:MAG: LPS assembly protein LptD [Pseudomonadales bacterium]|nr:LPS assembly protein LptD [Pseudomonadales bacterium]
MVLLAGPFVQGVEADSGQEITDTPSTRDHTFNWLPQSQLSAQQAEQVPPFCRGLYYYPVPEVPQNQPEQPTRISADQITHQTDSVSRMQGNIVVQQDSRLLKADSLTVETGQRKLELQGHLTIVDSDMVILAEQGSVDLDSHQSMLSDAQYLMLESRLHGEARTLERDAENLVWIREGSFTNCEPGDDSWIFYASEIQLSPETGFGSARHMHLEIAGVPVFYAPYLSFPIDDQRHTGFLIPGAGYTSSGGVEIVTPYYVNLADNYDLTLTPRAMSKRGLMLDTEFRYLGEQQSGRLDFGWLPQDQGEIDPVLGLEDDPTRWLIGWYHKQRFATGWSSEIHFNRASDIDYFRDLDFSGIVHSSRSHLDQSALVSYNHQTWSMFARYQEYQTLHLDLLKPYGTRPQLYLDGRNIFNTVHLPVDLVSEFVDFERDNTGLTGSQRVNGKRLTLKPSLSYSFEMPSGYIRPAITLWYVRYDLSDQVVGLDDTPELTVPIYSLDAGLMLERYFKIDGADWLHTIEPRVYFLDVAHEDQSAFPNFDTGTNYFSYAQLFRDNRFSGGDRIGDTRQMSLAVSSQLVNGSGREVVDFAVGRIFYFRDRTVTLEDSALDTEAFNSRSPVTGYLRYTHSDAWSFALAGAGNSERLVDADLRATYTRDPRHLVRFGYRFLTASDNEGRIEQPVLSTVWGLNDRWTAIASWDYDVAQNRTLDALAGLKYDDCCWSVSLYGRKWLNGSNSSSAELKHENAVFFEVQLKGFAETGDELSRILASKLYGFE